MLYDGVIGFKFRDLAEEEGVYVDSGRHVITLDSEEAFGLGDGCVTCFFDLADDSLLTIIQRCEYDSEIISKLDSFNAIQSRYHASYTVTDDGIYIDVSVVRADLKTSIEEAL